MPLTAVRPGHTIRDVLTGELVRQPYFTDEITEILDAGMAAANQMYLVYKTLVKARRSVQVGTRTHQRGMCYASFHAQVRFAKSLGLIQQVAEGPEVPPLVMIKPSNGGYEVEPARQIFYAITVEGQQATNAWDDLTRAWKLKLAENIS